MANKKVTLSLDEETYSDFKKFCEENDVMLSKRIERLIKKHMKENKGEKQWKKEQEKRSKRKYPKIMKSLTYSQ